MAGQGRATKRLKPDYAALGIRVTYKPIHIVLYRTLVQRSAHSCTSKPEKITGVPKILKMPKPPKAGKGNSANHGNERSVTKTTPMAEIILFPNGKNEIPLITGPHDPETKARWLHLADEALDGKKPQRKKA